jgi:hypothetical protein
MKVRVCMAVLASLLLAACEQAQMNGPVGGGVVSVEELRTGNVVYSGGSTLSLESAIASLGQERWDKEADFVQRALLGIHQFPDNVTASFEDDRWYLMKVEGGSDYGIDAEQFAETGPLQVFGTVHAIVKGAKLKASRFTLSPVTESAYQYVRDYVSVLDDDELQEVLNDLAHDLVDDVDENGQVDYIDVLAWNRLVHVDLLEADADSVDELTDAMVDGSSQQQLQNLAGELFHETVPEGVAEAVFAADINQPISQNKCFTCHNSNGIAAGTRHIVTAGSSASAIDSNVVMYGSLAAALGVQGILDKATGRVAHTGGQQLTVGSDDYNNFESFLELL